MIPKTASNRSAINDYLESIDEDQFIHDVVIPIFNQSGYIVYRINQHGPSEHGKDVIFYRPVRAFNDNEYIAVQAKSIKITAGNVVGYANQLQRALITPFPGKTGSEQKFANYAVLMNSKTHTNDANFEFPYLVFSNNIKILEQGDVCELMMELSIIPDSLGGKIKSLNAGEFDINVNVIKFLYKNDAAEIDNLFDSILAISKDQINSTTKQMVIEYVFNTWTQDRGWSGTVKPMKWLNKYFDFIDQSQYEKLEWVVDEYLSPRPSFSAAQDARNIIQKLTSEHIGGFKENYLRRVATAIRNGECKDVLVEKLIEAKAKYDNKEQRVIDLIEEMNSYINKPRVADEDNARLQQLSAALYEYTNERDLNVH